MISPEFDVRKTEATMLYILDQIGDSDLLKIFKILYFAERKHIAEYGSLILSDKFVAMPNGPVPSVTYDLFKAIRGDGFKSSVGGSFYESFEVYGRYRVRGKRKPDLDYLSQSNIECLNLSIAENMNLTFDELSQKSHDSAWSNPDSYAVMNFIEIAKAGEANNEMIAYIKETL